MSGHAARTFLTSGGSAGGAAQLIGCADEALISEIGALAGSWRLEMHSGK